MRFHVSAALTAFLIGGVCFGQMSYDDAMKKMQQDKEAQANAPSTRISIEDLYQLKSGLLKLGKEKADLEKQVTALKNQVPGTPQVGWKIDYIMHCAWITATDTRQAFNLQPNGQLQAGVPGQRVTITTAHAIQKADGSTVALTRANNTLRQLEKYTLIYNGGSGDPANCFRSANAYVDVDSGTVTQLDPDEPLTASVPASNAPTPRAVPTTYDEDLISQNKTLTDQLTPMLDQNGKLAQSLSEKTAQAQKVQADLSASQQKNRQLASQLASAQAELQNEPSVVPAVEAPAPAPAPAGMYLRVNALNVTLGMMILITVIVIAMRLAVR